MTALLDDEVVRAIGRRRLDLYVETNMARRLWRTQKLVLREISARNAIVCVPSCFASGKTFLAGRAAIAFYDSHYPSKVMTTSTDEDHLKLVLWSEIRAGHEECLIPVPGMLAPRDMRLYHNGDHFMLGRVPSKKQAFQGWHSPDILVIGDEATSIPDEMAEGIEGILTTDGARLLLIFNPTTSETYAARMCSAAGATVIRIRAWDTPNFSHMTAVEIARRYKIEPPENHVPTFEPSPPGAALLSPKALDRMISEGQGPGTYEWQTKVEAEFWTQGSTALISEADYKRALAAPSRPGPSQLGIDLAIFGDGENVICHRKGNTAVSMKPFPSMDADIFFAGPAADYARGQTLELACYDADGPGGAAFGAAQRAFGQGKVVPFRGSVPAPAAYVNMRSMWWWQLRLRFQSGDIRLEFDDSVLRRQLLSITYDVDEKGRIRVESKASMHRRNVPSPDRADALMYAFAMEIPAPREPAKETGVRSTADQDEYWERRKKKKLPGGRRGSGRADVMRSRRR